MATVVIDVGLYSVSFIRSGEMSHRTVEQIADDGED